MIRRVGEGNPRREARGNEEVATFVDDNTLQCNSTSAARAFATVVSPCHDYVTVT